MNSEERERKAEELRRQADELEKPEPYDIVDQWLKTVVIQERETYAGKTLTASERDERIRKTKAGYRNVVVKYLRWLDRETTPDAYGSTGTPRDYMTNRDGPEWNRRDGQVC